jgi:DNA-binding beta-propeller fold protein YncE
MMIGVENLAGNRQPEDKSDDHDVIGAALRSFAPIGRVTRRSQTRAIIVGTLTLCSLALGTAMLTRVQSTSSAVLPGASGDGVTLLANGWRLAPAGRQLPVGDLPLNAAASPDGRYLIVSNNGLAKPSLSVIDTGKWTVKSTTVLDQAWQGLVWHPDGTKVYSAGAAQNNVQEFSVADGVLTRARTFQLPSMNADTFVGGLAISPDGRTLYVTRLFAMTVSAVDLDSGQVLRTEPVAAEPYSALASADGRYLFVSIWGASMVAVLDSRTLQMVDAIVTGEHPSAMVLSADGRRVFVACASSAEVWVISTRSLKAIEQISTSLYPDAPATSTPNSVALSPDGRTLIVAVADNNAVAVIDVSDSARSSVSGFIPTGWYPTGALFSRDGRHIFILSGKGLASAPNPTNANWEKRLLGSIADVPTPDQTTLAEETRRVYALTAYSDAIRLTPANAPIGSPIPQSVGGSTPIKYVFYVIRENRSYDQILGDLPQGNGDPRLTLFGKDVTPNAHALAQHFALFDNFYVDADVSYNGHAFSTAAYATDFIEKLWQTRFGGRNGGPYLAEGGGFFRNPFGNIAAPPSGYIWDYAQRARISVRSYGEFVQHQSRLPNGDVTAVEAVPGLRGLVAPAFPGWDPDIKDNRRIDMWLQEFTEFQKNRNLPRLSIIRLANDHTNGTKPGTPTPRAMVADNDSALGRLVEAISNSPYWKESAIFVVEDDAQSGPDHIDAHRSVLLAASPFIRRGVTDHTFYTTSGVLRTIELILGLPPMSQYDAAATPLYAGFKSTPDLAPFQHVQPLVPLDEQNVPTAFGALASRAMDFSDADRAPEVLLNDIIWRSVKGATSPMPPPRRTVLVRPSGKRDED